MTGGRLKRVRPYVGDKPSCMTYGDGVVDIAKSVASHRENGKLATVTTVSPAARFGAMVVKNNLVSKFAEKPADTGKYIQGDETSWEREPMERLAREGQPPAFTHLGFWHPMDMLRDKIMLEELRSSRRAPWKVW